MPRKPRVVVPYGYYHVVSRGNNRQTIFDDWVRSRALARLAVVARRFEWRVYAWAVMSNHVHLLFRIDEGGLSEGMRQLNTGIAKDSNARFGRIDNCFGQRYHSTLVETEQHFFSAVRYTLWNPIRAGIADHPADTRWTSFRGAVGLEHPHPALHLSSLLEHFGPNPVTARRALAHFVLSARERCLAPWRSGDGILR